MPRVKSETFVSPKAVLGRFLLGVAMILAAFLWQPRTNDEQALWYILVVAGFAIVFSIAISRRSLGALKYAWNPFGTVVRIVEHWQPGPLKLESQYEKSLYDFLRGKLPGIKIVRQYGAGRIKCDIATSGDVIIELKVNLKSTQKLQRLIGQIELFRREWGKPIVVVLIGETHDDLLHDLHSTVKKYEKVELITVEGKEIQEESG